MTKKTAGKKPAAKRTTTTDAVAALADAVRGLKSPSMVSSEPMVGIRNISSYTIGLKSPFPQDEPDVQLAGPRYNPDAPTEEIADGNMVAVISHKWWQQLRREASVRKGMIVRDDAVLGEGIPRAPEDSTGTLPESAKINAIPNPFAWIEAKTEEELRSAIEAFTAEESVRRILTAVNQRIEFERRKMSLPVEGSPSTDAGIEAEEKALRNLPWRYAKAEEFALARLEAIFRARDNQVGIS